MKKILFLFVAMFYATVVHAYDFEVDGLSYNIISSKDHTVELAQGIDEAEVTIPTFITVKGSRYVVVRIGKEAFFNYDNVTSVTIPNTVTEIGYEAFHFCDGLSSFTIPNSVTRIGDYAFSRCSSLTSVTIPNSVTEIGYEAFFGCNSLISVTIPDSVTNIGYGAFGECESLSEIKVEVGNEYYSSEDGVLYSFDKTAIIQCPGGKTEYDIPNSVTKIVSEAFSGCSSLTSVTIPASVKSIEKIAFSGCSSLTSVTIPNSVTSIGERAFGSCISLTSVSISNSVTSIGDYAFSSCISLTSVTIPNSVTSIGDSAFSSCSSLESVVIPEKVKELEMCTFQDCEKLTQIIDLNPTPQRCWSAVFEGVPETAVVYIPKGSFVAYMVADGWSRFSDFREMGAFDVSLSVESLEIPVGDSATITATIEKDSDVTIGATEWSSSDPEVATVDDGKVTGVAKGSAVISYTVYDGYGVPHTESCKVTVSEDTGVDSIFGEDSAVVEVYTMNGVTIARGVYPDYLNTLPAGIYIVRQGSTSYKIALK